LPNLIGPISTISAAETAVFKGRVLIGRDHDG
jgi:hypothetical protein